MKRSKKTALLVAAGLVAVGLLLCLGTMAAIDFDFTKLNTTMQIAEGPNGPIMFGIFFGG